MKLVFEDKERERLQESYEILKKEGSFGCFFDDKDPDRVYSMQFKVKDPAIAEFILFSLLFDKDSTKDIDLGIDIREISLDSKLTNKEDVRQRLHQVIDEVLNNEK